LLARGNIETQFREAGAHRGLGERLHHRVVESDYDIFRRAFRGEETEPP
jgi:hypothetical protein